jgi:hypothetical protein
MALAAAKIQNERGTVEGSHFSVSIRPFVKKSTVKALGALNLLPFDTSGARLFESEALSTYIWSPFVWVISSPEKRKFNISLSFEFSALSWGLCVS